MARKWGGIWRGTKGYGQTLFHDQGDSSLFICSGEGDNTEGERRQAMSKVTDETDGGKSWPLK